jgi:hypothetical protein
MLGCMRFTEHELTAALTGAAKSLLASRKEVRKSGVDIDTAWEAMGRYERFQMLDALGGQILTQTSSSTTDGSIGFPARQMGATVSVGSEWLRRPTLGRRVGSSKGRSHVGPLDGSSGGNPPGRL